jgi:tetratricopeptide (TPR) repeat protein
MRMLRTPSLVLLALLAAAAAAPAPARAQATGSEKGDAAARTARREFQRAEAAFNLGKFEHALAAYEAAYQAKPLPGLLFNIAQCHRNMGNSDRALFFYRRYLAIDPNSPNRATVEELIAETERRRERASDATSPPSVVPPPADTGQAVAPPPVSAPPIAPSPSPVAPPSAVEPPGKAAPAEAAIAKAVEPPLAAGATEVIEPPAPAFVQPTPQPSGEAPATRRRWWIWATVAGVAVAGAATAIAISTGRQDASRPSGGLGVIDWR